MEELSYENEYLRNTCAEQESQIERLTNSLIGNKSHFARYVEVKTENLTLQVGQLDQYHSVSFTNLKMNLLLFLSFAVYFFLFLIPVKATSGYKKRCRKYEAGQRR